MPDWWVTRDGDLDLRDAFLRHYSSSKRVRWRESELCIGPGDKLALHTAARDAFFVWRNFVDDCIDQRTGEPQQGVNCAIFRNEGQHLSSRLIRAADAIADEVWTDRRHYTYVRREAVRSANPGFCFTAAGWRRCGTTAGGLLVLERIASGSDLNEGTTS